MKAGEQSRLLCVGTHHKSGTVWMRRVFHRIAAEQGVPLTQINRADRLATLGAGPQILVNWASTFPPELLERPDARFLHLVRDPRDMLISATHYHLKAGLAREPFLAATHPSWGGRTYRDMLRALPDFAARLRFEMDGYFARVMAQLERWPFRHPRALELRYEDLIADADGRHFGAAFDVVAPQGLDRAAAVTAFKMHALGGDWPPSQLDRLHRRSGASGQWRSEMPRDVAARFEARHGALLRRYGYAEDASWVEACELPGQSPTAASGDAA